MLGQQISHYRLTAHLGAGSYGDVWKGVHVDDPAFVVAVKLIPPSVQREAGFIDALRRECRILDRMDHPGVVRFRELVVRDGVVAMVLELLEGEDLEAALQRGPQPVAEVVRVLELALEGLAYAHGQGLLHRDIKPANVYRCRDGRVKLMDFGLSRAVEGSRGTKSGVVKGTLDYMAPERFSKTDGASADVYALGLVAWELLAGRRAAPEGDLPAKFGWHMMTGAGDVRTARPDCPAWLAELLLAMTAREVSARPADGAAALGELRRLRAAWTGAASGGAPPRPPGTVEVKVGPRPGPPPSPSPSPTPRPSPSPSPPPTVEERAGPRPGPAPAPSPAPAPPERGTGMGGMVLLGLLVVGGVVVAASLSGGDEGGSEGSVSAAPVPAPAPAVSTSGPADYPMVKIPSGSFTMGSPKSEEGREDDEVEHRVTLTRSFLMGKTEVTQALWRSVMGSNPSAKEYEGVSLLGDTLPVQNVSWCDAVTFANKLSARNGLPAAYQGVDQCSSSDGTSVVWDQTNSGFRLPTEAEWEYAARGGVGGPYAGGVKAEGVCAVGNVLNPKAKEKFGFPGDPFACDDGHLGASPVGAFGANPYGLHDMTGNVWEWCWDWYEAYTGSSTDPVGAQSGPDRVIRGGSWLFDPRSARVANRYGREPGIRDGSLGLRLVRTIP